LEFLDAVKPNKCADSITKRQADLLNSLESPVTNKLTVIPDPNPPQFNTRIQDSGK